MITVTAWLALTVILGLACSLAIWARGFSRARGLAVVSFLASMPAAALALCAALSYPIPLINGLTVPAGKLVVLGFKIIPDQAIFVLLDVGADMPRYYSMPFSNQQASELQDAADEGADRAGNGDDGKPRLDIPKFEWSWDQQEPKFYPDPQPIVLPLKPDQDPPPTFNSD